MIRELGESDLFEIWHTFTNVCNCFAYALLDQTVLKNLDTTICNHL